MYFVNLELLFKLNIKVDERKQYLFSFIHISYDATAVKIIADNNT